MYKYLIIILFLSGFLIRPVLSKNDTINYPYSEVDSSNKSIGLFETDELLEIALRFDISYFKKHKPEDEYLDAILTINPGTSDSINKEIKVSSRGVFRRTFCDFPPIMLYFEIHDSSYNEPPYTNKLKIVTHCRQGDEEYLLKEYLIYKLYNIITDNSFKVRLLRISYFDVSRKRKPKSEFAFVIEPVEILANRLNSVVATTTSLTQKSINPEIINKMAIFNYMVGNSDWIVSNLHNIELMVKGEADKPSLRTVVPFDFDFAGFVDAPYAKPAEGFGLKTVRDRHYFGICRSEEEFRISLKEFSDSKEEFFKLIREFPYLKTKTKNEILNYLNEFYLGLESHDSLVNIFLNECQKF